MYCTLLSFEKVDRTYSRLDTVYCDHGYCSRYRLCTVRFNNLRSISCEKLDTGSKLYIVIITRYRRCTVNCDNPRKQIIQ
jgi:hypothetical protein